MNADCGIVLVAAGQGTRMGAVVPKQFLPLLGMPLYLWSLHFFERHESVREVVVVTPPGYERRVREETQRYLLKKVTACVPGGELRQESVFAGVRALDPACALVAVHDAARPFPPVNFDDLIHATRRHRAALFAVPVTDTIKRVENGLVTQTVARAGLWAAQTPQLFERELLLRALLTAKEHDRVATDDAAMVEMLGVPAEVVLGSRWNLKVTTPEDWPIAEHIARTFESTLARQPTLQIPETTNREEQHT